MSDVVKLFRENQISCFVRLVGIRQIIRSSLKKMGKFSFYTKKELVFDKVVRYNYCTNRKPI